MNSTPGQPLISVGIITGVEQLELLLGGTFRLSGGAEIPAGEVVATASESGLRLTGPAGDELFSGKVVELDPVLPLAATFLAPQVRIGIGFHWERFERQRFTGSIRLKASEGSLTLINVIGVEDYLASVISSEMSATSHPELLRAHAITSRSWLLAQLKPWKVDLGSCSPPPETAERIRWYDRENHADFDVCADDHCQRYQGITKATTDAVRAAIVDTYGKALVYHGRVCDARYSKSCGGMSEDYRAAWQDFEIPYLSATVCGKQWPSSFSAPLTTEENARAWIAGNPAAYCNTTDAQLLSKILPDFDQETIDFFRWQRTLAQDELQELLERKLGLSVGNVLSLEAVERGRSARIIRLRISGDRDTVVIGKELEIRRALSASHLLSSAFFVEDGPKTGGVPDSFLLNGAGWGHGVGLCQIGAAEMAERGIDSVEIVLHYFLNAEIKDLYGR